MAEESGGWGGYLDGFAPWLPVAASLSLSVASGLGTSTRRRLISGLSLTLPPSFGSLR